VKLERLEGQVSMTDAARSTLAAIRTDIDAMDKTRAWLEECEMAAAHNARIGT